MNYLTIADRKLNPEPASATAARPIFGTPAPPLSEDAKAELRGELVTLRAEIRRAATHTGDRATQLHLMGADHRIGDILEPKRP